MLHSSFFFGGRVRAIFKPPPPLKGEISGLNQDHGTPPPREGGEGEGDPRRPKTLPVWMGTGIRVPAVLPLTGARTPGTLLT